MSLPTEGTVTQIAASFDHGLVLTSTGQLYAFGGNSSGFWFKGKRERSRPTPTPTLISLPGAHRPVAPRSPPADAPASR